MGIGDTVRVNYHPDRQKVGKVVSTYDLHPPPEPAQRQHIVLCTPNQPISCSVVGVYGHEAISRHMS